jgi:hypothetical protein
VAIEERIAVDATVSGPRESCYCPGSAELLVLKYIIELSRKSAGKITSRASKSRLRDIRPLHVILVDLK